MTRRRVLTTGLKAALSLGLLALLLRAAGLASLLQVLRHIQLPWLLGALALGLLSSAVQTTQWRALLRAVGLQRTWLRCLRVVFIGNSFNTLLPTAVGGDVARAVVIAESPAERPAAASTVILQRLCNFPGMVAVMMLGLILTLGEPAAARVRPVAVIGIVAGLAVVGMCMSPLLGWLARRQLFAQHRAGRAFSEVLVALDAFRGRRGELAAAWARGTVFWMLAVLNQWGFMHALGLNVPLPLAILVVTTINALTLLPISINGFGVREGGFAAFLSVGGVATASQGVATGLLVSGQSLLWALIGIACLWAPGHPRLGRRRTHEGSLEVAA
jgi:glycosyltransferase 2 family protein